MKTIARALAVVAVLGLGVGAVMAQGKGETTRAEHQSESGAGHGAFADQNGNFGFLGDVGGTPGYHDGAKGQEPGATGYNNSHCCGVGQDDN